MLSWLVAGIGDISRKRVLPAILAEPNSRLAAIVTRDPAKAGPYGVPGFTTLDAALAGGGPLRDIASHRIDLMNYLFGSPARASVYRSNLVHELAVEDNATAMIEYASGVRGVVDVRWHSRVSRDEFRIRGTDGE